jgi:hypothetical protein
MPDDQAEPQAAEGSSTLEKVSAALTAAAGVALLLIAWDLLRPRREDGEPDGEDP